ncbi:TlpA disulfide reductase family protein [Nocardioides montaniterrae]
MRRTSALLAGVLAAATLSACSAIGGTNGADSVTGDGKVVSVAASKRGAPVEVSGTTIQGDPLSLESLRGKVVVVNVWWSGCGPCRKEMPMLVDTERSFATGADKGKVAFVGINIRDASTANAAAFERDRGVDYPSLYDPASKTLLDFGKYAPYAPPATLVLDQQGRVAALVNGPIPSQTTLTDVVDELLGSTS